MLLAPKPQLNLFAGWHFLLHRQFRDEVREQWQSEPIWIIALQVTAGACSVAFPLLIVGLLAFVFFSRHL